MDRRWLDRRDRRVDGDEGAQAQEPGEMLRRDRAGEQEALAELAAELAQALELAGLLDPFGDDPQPERLAEGDDGVGERPGPPGRPRPRRRSPGRSSGRRPGSDAGSRATSSRSRSRRPRSGHRARGSPGAGRSSSPCRGTSRSRSARARGRPGRDPVSARTASISSTKSIRCSWSGETLTLSRKCSAAPAARSAATVRHASASTQRPSGQDRPVLLGEPDELVRTSQAARRVPPADERLDADRLDRC